MRMTGSMGTLVLVVTFILPFFVRLVLKLVLILMALLLPCDPRLIVRTVELGENDDFIMIASGRDTS